MKARNGETPIQLPDIVKGGDPITARWANGIRAAVQRLRDRTPVVYGSKPRAKQLRFDVILKPQPKADPSDPQTYKVSITDGRVVEIDRTKGDNVQAMILHTASNRLTAGVPTEFSIGINQAVYIYVPETANGPIDGANVSIVVDSDTKKSTNFTSSSLVGKYYYKLAELRTIDGQARIVPFCSGSNIFHETGLNADWQVVACDTDPEEQKARLRFCGGRLAGIDEDPDVVPLSSNLSKIEAVDCAHTHTP